MEQETKKKFKETALGQWLTEKAPDILSVAVDLAGTAFPPAKAISKLIKTDPKLTPEQKLEGQKLSQQYALDYEHEITVRIESAHELEKQQLAQEDLWTKRARPTRQYFWLIFLTLCFPFSKWMSGAVIDLPDILLIGILGDFGFYHYQRTKEKIAGKQ